MAASSSTRPGVWFEPFTPVVEAPFQTGVAGFLAPAVDLDVGVAELPQVRTYTSWHDFAYAFTARRGAWLPGWHPDALAWHAVQGFFANGGARCHVAFYDPSATGDRAAALAHAVAALAEVDADVVCAPSLAAAADRALLLRTLIGAAEAARTEQDARWFLVLDAPPPAPSEDVAAWIATAVAAHGGAGPFDAALYHPWLVPGGDVEACPGPAVAHVPPCGHVAGVYARSDRRAGVHRAPANEELAAIVDLAGSPPETRLANPIEVFPGRGIRVWGARTLGATRDPNAGDSFVNVRRLVLTLERWLVRALAWAAFEPNDLRLWIRIQRELEDKLGDLFTRGALAGRSPAEAFLVKCDAENNPAEARARGELYVDVSVAPAAPQEFITIRLVRSAEGLTVAR
ncbi:MAG: phage tail sheath family protein [Deltaproteobacteria bacterium]|nr:phage tail sheath family protein [Deltaproteobacteria bacterium]